MDPLSVIASSLALATPLVIGIQKLQATKRANTDLLMLANEVAEITILLQELQQILEQPNGAAEETRPNAMLMQAIDETKTKLEQLSVQISEWNRQAPSETKSRGLRWVAVSSKVKLFKEELRRIRSHLRDVRQTIVISTTTRVAMSLQEVFILVKEITTSQRAANSELQTNLSMHNDQPSALLRRDFSVCGYSPVETEVLTAEELPGAQMRPIRNTRVITDSNYRPVVSLKVQRTVPGNADIFTYAKLGDVDKIKMLFESGLASPHDVHAESGITPLHMALNHQHIRVCELLLQANADPFITDFTQCTSADNAWTKILSGSLTKRDERKLRDLFSETECIERRELTVLHKIVLGLTYKDIGVELAASTADINVQETVGRTPLSMAAERGNVVALTALLQYGADPSILSHSSNSPLHYAVCAKDPECIRLLLEAGSEVDCTTNWEQTPLIHAAAYTKDARHAKLLIDAGASCNKIDREGMTPLGWCAISNNSEVASLLLESNADIEIIDNDGSSALQRCIKSNQHDVLKLLVERKPRIEACMSDRETFLHLITAYADEETMRILQQMDISETLMNQCDGAETPVMDILMGRSDYSTELKTAYNTLVQDISARRHENIALSVSEEEDVWEDAAESFED